MRKKHWKASPLPSTQKGLPTHVMPRDGRVFSVPPTIESGALVTQQKTPPSQVSTLAKCKKILQDLSSPQWEHIVYECVSLSNYIYIMYRLESDEYRKMWNRLKLTFFIDSQCLMALSPTAAHESVLKVVLTDLTNILDTIPIHTTTISCDISASAAHQGSSIRGVPDLMVQMWQEGHNVGSLLPQMIWVIESVFSQSDHDTTDKLLHYVEDIPGLLVVGKLLLKQATPFRSPGSDESIVRDLQSSELMSRAEWTSYASAEGFTSVTMDSYTWFSLTSVEFHLWIHKPGELKIRMHCLDEDSYAYRMIYPNVAFDNVKNTFWCGLELTKTLILATLGNLEEDKALLDCVGNWTPPPRIINPDKCLKALSKGAWATSYDRYFDWCKKQEPESPCDVRHSTCTSRNCT
ncbi:hypothetical protein SCLCIDRAFT_27076 [Scleroderma citrinum Foug A]|uniref:Uncharacterized protein n=1 Tax=Scleroderma citrinum Foug A TaxID=1036808 RepID=A0A0C3DV60_9AGAM|nr:hypothetical protein SCLCIDRAFT_27076 [Scleroderma citrinum Foug A]